MRYKKKPTVVINSSKQHLKETKLNYWQHFYFAGRMTLWLGKMLWLSAIHTVIPGFYPFRAEEEGLKFAKAIKKRRRERNQ